MKSVLKNQIYLHYHSYNTTEDTKRRLMQVFKIIETSDNMDCSECFTLYFSTCTLGNGCKFVEKSLNFHELKKFSSCY